ncbi:MAG TPA: twin-arginine translocase TatA/TatE family subunit [Allosphingosinicella sp.]|jgi:sec-independent protein translocase protein TatA
MGSFSIWHWLIVLLVIALLFGAGRISGVMGDVGKGIKSFKKGLSEDDDGAAAGASKPQGRITDERVGEPSAGTTSADRDKI